MSAPGIRLDFSEPISLTSPIAGLVSVRPSVDVRFSIRDNSLFLLGDFELGTRYSVVVAPGVRATSGAMTRERREYPITLEDIKPQIRFSSDGVFLTSGARSRLRFATVNVRSVRVVVKRVFENNLGQFLQTERLSSLQGRRGEFRASFVNRVGVVVAEEELEIGE